MVQVPIATGPSVGPSSLPGARIQGSTPRDFVGPAIQRLGEQLGSTAAAVDQINAMKDDVATRQGENAFMGDANSVRAEFYTLQGSNASDQLGDYKQKLQDARETALAGMKSDRARKMLGQVLDQHISNLNGGFEEHALGELSKADIASHQARADRAADDAITATDETARNAAIATGMIEIGMADAKLGLGDDVTADKQRQYASTIHRTIGVGLATTGTADAAQAYLDQNKTAMRGTDIASAQKAIQVRRDRDSVEQRQQDSLIKHQAREELATLSARIANGEQVSDADMATGERLAVALGDTSEGYKIGVQRQRSAINDSTKNWLPQQYHDEINKLLAKGKDRTSAEDIELDQLQKIAPQRIANLRNDPAQWGAMNGAPAPQVSWTDPSSLQARAQWTRAMRRATGLQTPFLTADERQQMQDLAASGPQGRLRVIDQIGAIGNISRADAVSSARDVLPNDALAAHLVLLNAQNRSSALRGAEARKANTDLIDKQTMQGGGDGPARMAIQSYRANVAPALALQSQADSKAVYDIAGNMYADWATQNGVSDFNEGQFNTFMQVALGARRDADGVFHGGVGYVDDHPVLLPSDMSNAQFNTHLARLSWGKDSPHAPYWANGQMMEPKDIRGFTPVARPDGAYQFVKDGTILRGKDHNVWTVRFSASGIAQ